MFTVEKAMNGAEISPAMGADAGRVARPLRDDGMDDAAPMRADARRCAGSLGWRWRLNTPERVSLRVTRKGCGRCLNLQP